MNERSRVRGAGLAAALLVAAFCYEDAHGQDVTRDRVHRLNYQLLETAIVHRDSTLLASVALDQLRVIAPGGIVETRAEALRGVSAFSVDSIAVRNVEITLHDHTAIVVGRLDLFGEIRGIGAVGPLRFMSVFVETSGDWRLMARSLTPCRSQAVSAGRC